MCAVVHTHLLARLRCHPCACAFAVCLVQSFHIATGLDSYVRYRMRKAIRLWMSRARVRRGLRKQIRESSLKGTNLLRMLEMADESDVDDLANALLARDAESCTPLLWASKKGHSEVAESLLGLAARCVDHLGDEVRVHGTCVAAVVAAGDRCAQRARSTTTRCRTCVCQCCCCCLRISAGTHLLGLAMRTDNDHCCSQTLLYEIANSNDSDGNSALHWAARKGHADVAAMLLGSGAHVNSRNAEGSTPLHWAARKQHVPLLRVLIEGGAELSTVNKWGATALEQAQSFDQRDAVALLKEAAKRQGGKGAAEGSGAPPKKKSPPPKKAWGEGPGSNEKNPIALREAQERRRREAEVRRQEALKAREAQEELAHKDQQLRRKRQLAEIKLRELMDAVGGGDRSRSPPKVKLLTELSETIGVATEVGVVGSLVANAQARLSEAQEIRKAVKKSKEAADGSPRRGKKAGNKDTPNKELAKMERKMAKKMGR